MNEPRRDRGAATDRIPPAARGVTPFADCLTKEFLFRKAGMSADTKNPMQSEKDVSIAPITR
jgi:hypothetical protein